MNLLRPLLADFVTVKLIMFVVVIAIYAINHLLSGLRKGLPGQPPRIPPPARPPAEQPPQADMATPAQRPDLNAELNEFLRRAAAKRQEAAGRAPQASPPRTEPARPRKRKKQDASAATPEQSQSRLTERQALPRLGTRITEELKPTVGEKFGDHVREVFDRQLGNLGGAVETAAGAQAQVPTPELPPSLAAELSALLYNPQSLRGAIILNEVLTRPEHRW